MTNNGGTMKKIKSIAVLCASIALLAVLCVQAFAAVNNISPNYATNSHDDMSIYYYGYVQCRPSYNEDGQHAQAGYIRYWRYDLLGNIVNDTGRLYTDYGIDQTDSRLLTRSHTYTDSIIPNPHKTQFRYGFMWQPHRDEPILWPLPFSTGNATE